MRQSEGKNPFGRLRRRWEDNIKIDLKEVEWSMNWIYLTQDRDRWRTLVKAIMILRVPQNVGIFLTNCEPLRFTRTLLHGVSKYVGSTLIVAEG